MVIHTVTCTSGVSSDREFQKHMCNNALKDVVIDQGISFLLGF